MPLRMYLVLVLCDLTALACAALLALVLRVNLPGGHLLDPGMYLPLWPFLGVFLLAFRLFHVLPSVGMSPAEELRRTTLATSIMYVAIATSLFLLKEGATYSRLTFVFGWAFSVLLVPLFRGLVHSAFAPAHWWGYPAVVLGASRSGERLVRALVRSPRLCLKPVAILDDDPSVRGAAVEGVPVVGGLDVAPRLAAEGKAHDALVAIPDADRDAFYRKVEAVASLFRRVTILPNLPGVASIPHQIRDIGGMMGIEIQNRLLLPGPRLVKRATDLGIAVCAGLVLSPLLLALALLVKLTSRGPALYSHVRIGHGGRKFRMWKFRTMVANAGEMLEECLGCDPELMAEWTEKRKLRQDPRVTLPGRFLRRWSLDELPQLWNVVCGEMSLVGPRPIVEEEVPLYADGFGLYRRVLPGITGLWQVSGRTDTSYPERIWLDTYYVENWSVWLDIHVLAATWTAVLRREGAY